MPCRRAAAALALAASALPALRAHAEEITPQVELVAGMVEPLAGAGDYEGRVSRGPRVGVQGVALIGPRRTFNLGIELAADYAQQTEYDEWSFERWRVMIGGRAVYRASPYLDLFARGLGGVDRAAGTITVGDPTDPERRTILYPGGSAFLLQVGVGATFHLGDFVLGVQVDLPVAFYDASDAPPPGPGETPIDPTYMRETSLDLDLLATAGVTF
jgi:hypothetical protein